ncbi:TetR/AcrR family transcriptional regulator [Streptomyces sp. SID5789]|uniref:TetR/AcrR family transcriptional regulator n=1 Tax=Streptomyces sp. SID5789 TaxID=2690310 RepID=UPI00136CA54C|nr:TetR/AcrR family transcriptional regulator [Streptomyces sp. SID5789]MZE70095.1 TetR family transcriptional regulator [Streptomyces sp. SID5789]MZE71335.1 TetR family transcriptional regulator [Streptomyces sp. SID5789]
MTGEGSLRERLIDVGVDLVLTEGSASVGLREIARRAGVSHGAPRRYFPTHHALLSAIARRGFEDLGARFEAAVAGTSTPRGELHALARAYVGYALERRGMFELMWRHDLLDSEPQPSDQPRLRESTLPLFGHLTELVARCRSERHAAQHTDWPNETAPPPAVTAAALWSNLHGIAQLWAWGSLQLALGAPPPGRDPGDDRRDRLITAVLDAHLGPVTA